MRWLMVILLVLLAYKYLVPEPEPMPIEETFIAEPVGRLQEAEQIEDQYLQQSDERKRRLEEAMNDDG